MLVQIPALSIFACCESQQKQPAQSVPHPCPLLLRTGWEHRLIGHAERGLTAARASEP